ncbi:MAG TPA: molybdopterin cofactor-binding domain-containing protein, partial [Thermoanaerobaculia bacterium]
KTDRFGLSAADGKVTDRSGRALTYGVLTEGRDLLRIVDEETATTPPKEWRVAGAPAKKVGGRDFVTGRHEYASDVSRPGMLYGKILRPAGFRATLASLDAAKAEAMPGVKVVRDGDFVGVAAPDPAAARRALSALEARWSESPGQPSDREIFEFLKKNAGPADDRGTVGSIDAALSAAEVKASGAYTVAYIAHAPLEPRAAVAEWSGGKLTVWTGTQRPFAVRDELAESLRLPPEGVRVIVPDTGSAYGGKHTGDAAIEAARLAKAAGKPVRVVWTREEEFTWAYFRPAGLIEVASGAGKDGKITAWEFHNYNSGPAAIGTPYDVPNRRIAYHPVDSPLRQGSYRALAATANHFARETHMDELAHEIGTDPLAFRLKNLADKRLSAVFEAAADKFGWSRAAPGPRRGFGIAGGLEKGGYVAACVEVEVDESTRRLRLVRIVQAFECGAVVNPDGIRNQIEGSVVQGLGGALFEAVRFENGRISNPHFAQYRVPRFPDVPPIELVVLDRKDLPPAGASETPIVAVAPAIGNAVFRAAGVRLRALPLVPDGIVRPTGAAEAKPAGTPGI